MAATYEFTGTTLPEARRFLRETATLMTLLRWVHVTPTETRVSDVNRAAMVFPGVTFGHPLMETVLKEAGASFDPALLLSPMPPDHPGRDFYISAKYPWAHDRVD